MRPFLSAGKEVLFKITALVLFYSAGLRLIGLFVNRFQPKKNGETGFSFPFIRRRRSGNVQILGYHRVNDDNDAFFPATPTRVFAKQMDYVAMNYNPLSLEEAVERIRRDDVPDNAVVVTFDDGYRDNYLNAFPILKGLSIPATIFLATGGVSSGKVLWHERVFSAFRETRVSFLERFGNNPKGYPLKTLAEKLLAQREVLEFLRSLNDRERSFWIDRLLEELRVVNRKTEPGLMLTWDEVRIMHKDGISFGSHTVSHTILSRTSVSRAREEIFESKRIIEQQLGIAVKTFAYPGGRKDEFNEVTKNLLNEAGYLCAVTAIFGSNEATQDLFELQRGRPWEEHLPSFATKLSWYKFRY